MGYLSSGFSSRNISLTSEGFRRGNRKEREGTAILRGKYEEGYDRNEAGTIRGTQRVRGKSLLPPTITRVREGSPVQSVQPVHAG